MEGLEGRGKGGLEKGARQCGMLPSLLSSLPLEQTVACGRTADAVTPRHPTHHAEGHGEKAHL